MRALKVYIMNKKMYTDLRSPKHDRKYTKIIEHYKDIHLIGGNNQSDTDFRNNFYFTHMVAGGENVLLTILEDGFLKPGKDVTHSNVLSANKLDYVFGNINFCDLNNIDFIHDISLQFSHKLILDPARQRNDI